MIDEYTKECLALRVGYSLRAIDAIKVLEAAIARYGSPEYLRSDNGPEFMAKAIQDWTKEQRIGSIYITPGSPWEQAHVESFHDKLRDECLNRELFGSLAEPESSSNNGELNIIRCARTVPWVVRHPNSLQRATN